jgi:hypothetical protein
MGKNNSINMRLWKSSSRLFLVAGLLFLCGCATTNTQSLFTVSGPGWHVQQGQALWMTKKGGPQLGGDIVFATDDTGRSYAQFEKMPLSIVMVQTTPKEWFLHFAQGGGTYKGHEPATTRTVWLHLADALAGKPLPQPLHFEQETNGNWRLENLKTGEILEGFLSP